MSRTTCRFACHFLPVLVLACATRPPPKPTEKVVAPPPAAAPVLEKMHEPLEVLPLELFFSGVRGVAKSTESVTVRNTGDASVAVSELLVVGSQAATFTLTDLPPLPLLLRPNQAVTVTVGFAPPADAAPGVHRARLRIVRSGEDDGPPCDMSALVATGTDLGSEPRLPQILETLGYASDVGPVGADAAAPQAKGEVTTRLFQHAKPGSVGLYVVARYAHDESSSYGSYALENGKLLTRPMGSIAKGHNQTLNPELDGEGQTSFDPGENPFGIYVKLPKRTLYSEVERNTDGGKHAMRIFQLRSRGGSLVPDALLVVVDEDGDGDFQDYVFTLVNVRPAR
ncbi:MAG TPA: hypothetical protein VF518_00105 [Polyangia bacterium]